MNYRPSGELDFVLGLSNAKDWVFVGALGTEERSLAAWLHLRSLGIKGEHRLFEIRDDPSDYSVRSKELLAIRRTQFSAEGGSGSSIRQMSLLARMSDINEIVEEIEKLGRPIILDITSLPKRFFFLLLRAFSRCDNLIVTYTSPDRYEEKDPLSQGAVNWTHLPGFPKLRDGKEMLIASVGYMIEGLITHSRGINSGPRINVLIPFPAPLTALRHSWESVWRLESEHTKSAAQTKKFENHRVGATDMSLAFDRIVSLTRGTSEIPAFAPFGPKPISAAMCLFASQPGYECAVYYQQPPIYHPDYSVGIQGGDRAKAVKAYWVKHDGENLYRVT